MYCRSSVQIGHAAGALSEVGYCVPQAEQRKAGMGLRLYQCPGGQPAGMNHPVFRHVQGRSLLEGTMSASVEFLARIPGTMNPDPLA